MRAGGTQTVRLVTVRPVAAGRLVALPAVQDVAVEGNVATFRVARPTEMLAALTPLLAAEKNEIVDLQIRQASLEDVFIALTQGEAKS